MKYVIVKDNYDNEVAILFDELLEHAAFRLLRHCD